MESHRENTGGLQKGMTEMKKQMMAAGALTLTMLAGCSTGSPAAADKENSTGAGTEKTVQIVAKDQDGQTVLDESVVTTADTLTGVLENSDALQAKLEEGQYGTMVMGLGGLETEDWNKGPWWTYESDNNAVCQEESYCPAADDVKVEDGDRFVFTFSSGS